MRSTRGPSSAGATAAPAKTEGDVVEHGHVREQRVRLEDQAEVAAMHGHPRDVLAREDDLPAVGLDEAGHHAEERALAAARGPEEGEELAGRGVERDVVDRDHGAERLAEPADGERRRGAAHRRRRARVNARSRAPSAPTTPGTSSPRDRYRGRTCAGRAGRRARASPDRPGAGPSCWWARRTASARSRAGPPARGATAMYFCASSRFWLALGTETVGTMPIAPSLG